MTTSPKYFAGIGSRETPPGVKSMIEEVCRFLAHMNFILRSGGAPGADSMFENFFSGDREIYLPWRGFNNNLSELFLDSFDHLTINQAQDIAKSYHPRWNQLSDAAKKLMSRNSFQILGRDLQTPSSFVVCWTKGGTINGGTGQAMRIAKHMQIPIFNLYHKDSLHNLKVHITNLM